MVVLNLAAVNDRRNDDRELEHYDGARRPRTNVSRDARTARAARRVLRVRGIDEIVLPRPRALWCKLRCVVSYVVKLQRLRDGVN